MFSDEFLVKNLEDIDWKIANLVMESHGKIMEFCALGFVGTLQESSAFGYVFVGFEAQENVFFYLKLLWSS